MCGSGSVALIREDLAVYNFEYDPEHLDRHMGNEGFDIEDVVTAAVHGDVIEETLERNRWLFCGTVPRLRLRTRSRERWLHVSVESIEATGTAVVTAYRPDVNVWRTERERR